MAIPFAPTPAQEALGIEHPFYEMDQMVFCAAAGATRTQCRSSSSCSENLASRRMVASPTLKRSPRDSAVDFWSL